MNEHMNEKKGKIILISGEFENGKTTLCLKLLDVVQNLSVTAKGVICPPVFVNGKKTGIDILNVESHEQRRLAVLHKSAPDIIHTTRWQFDQESMEWGNEILSKAVPCNLLFVDELGPLEFEHGEGWQNGLKAIDSRAFTLAVAVVRPRLIDNALQRWPDAEVVTITRNNREIILDQIIKEFTSVSFME